MLFDVTLKSLKLGLQRITGIATSIGSPGSHAALPTEYAVHSALSQKQDTLVSGINIKTVNSESLLGSGDVKIDAIKIRVTEPAHGFVAGDVLRKTHSGYTLALADTMDNAEIYGIVESVIDDDTFVCVTLGMITLSEETLVEGSIYYLSDTVSGDYSTIQPTTPTAVIKPCMIALTSTTAYVLHQIGVLVGFTGNMYDSYKQKVAVVQNGIITEAVFMEETLTYGGVNLIYDSDPLYIID